MKPYRRRPGVIKALKVLKIWSDAEGHDYVREFNRSNNWTKRMVNTRSPCSCSCCGNPRHIKWGNHGDHVSLQERRAEISYEEQVNDALSEGQES